MKNILLGLFVLFSSFLFSQCLTATYGLYPSTNFTPTCGGSCIYQNITTAGYGGEYSRVNVVSGNTYKFKSSITSDFVTIGSSTGTIAYASGLSGVNGLTWVSTITGTIRFYTHLNASCGNSTVSRTRSVCCIGTPPPPGSCTNTSAYLTATMPSTPGLFYVGTCTFQGDYNTFNSVVAGRQYRSTYSLGGWITVRHTTPGGTLVTSGPSPLTWTATISGTYYVHYNTNSSCGTAFSCGTDYIECLTCTAPPPPSNDLVCNSTSITCGQSISGTTVNATNSGTGEGGFCSVSQTQPGVWYVIPGNGQIMTANLCATAWDSKMSVFSGVGCGSLTCVGGNDDFGPACGSSSASYSWSSVVGTNYYILVHGYSTSSSFSINVNCVAPPTPGPCINTISYGTQSLPVFGGISYTTVPCQFAGEYSTWSGAVVGTPYIAMTTVATDWITVRSGAYNGTVVAVGLGPLSFTPTNNNTLYIHVNTNSLCGTVSVCRDVSVTRMSALPIELFSFEGKKQVNSNMLYWSTASEHNSSHFIIEKSVDGFKWSDIGQVQSAGNSTQKIDYSLEDKDVSQVINYYRLHQYDIDGVDEVFGPIAINNRDRINIIAKRINLAGQEVNENATGIIIEIYEDGSIKRIIR
jgi:hypothetical protein